MVQSDQSPSEGDGLSRLVTFETSDGEQLLVRVGISEVDNRLLWVLYITPRLV